jgi:phosphate transport system substrate-binding protein
MKRWRLLLAVLLLSGLVGTVWSDEGQNRLTWVGCGITKKAFMEELAAAYQKKTGIEIDIAGGGATKGIRDVKSLAADMGGSCRYRLDTPDESVELNPVAWDALVVIVNPANPVSNISMDQLRGIYLGEINSWKALDGPDQPIDLMIRKGKISGVGRTLRQLVFHDFDIEFPAADEVHKSTGPLEQAIEKNPWAVGVTGISSARKRNVKILDLEGHTPTFDNIRSGEYLLYRPLYLVLNRSSPNYAEALKFVDFAHSQEGRDVIRKNGVVPYLEAVSLIGKQRDQWRESRKALSTR